MILSFSVAGCAIDRLAPGPVPGVTLTPVPAALAPALFTTQLLDKGETERFFSTPLQHKSPQPYPAKLSLIIHFCSRYK